MVTNLPHRGWRTVRRLDQPPPCLLSFRITIITEVRSAVAFFWCGKDAAATKDNITYAAMKALSKLLPPTNDMIDRAGGLIAKAKRPIAVLGSSAMRLAKPELLREVVERHNLPFATTTMAKGMIDEDHPLSIGVIHFSTHRRDPLPCRGADPLLSVQIGAIHSRVVVSSSASPP